MLEKRQDYFSFGDNNPDLVNLVPIRVKYSDYKNKYSTNKTVSNSYDKTTKTIEVYFTKDQVEKLSNLGNIHTRQTFTFILKDNNNYLDGKGITGELIACEFNAKTLENATKNAKKWAKLSGYEFICEVANNRNIQSYGAKKIITCTL